MGFILMMNGANCTDFPPDVTIPYLNCTKGFPLSRKNIFACVNKKIRINCKKVCYFKVSLPAKTMNKTDLSHCGQQHICVISGRYNQ